MFLSRTAAIGLIIGSALGAVAGTSAAYAEDVIVPAAFVVTEVPQEPQPTVAPLPPSRTAAFAPRQVRSSATQARAVAAPRVERVAYAEPRRRIEAGVWSFGTRPNFMWLGTVY